MPTATRLRVAAAAGAVLVTAAACGSARTGAPHPTATITPSMSGGVQVFDLTGEPTLVFSAKELDAKPGTIRVNFSVPAQSPPHNFVVPLIAAAKTPVVSAGSSASVTFTVTKPGTYQFLCTIHTNMSGTLKVS